MTEKIAIIGAGLAGATAARHLKDAGANVTVFEKSGGTGGRLSTRRTEYGPFDHGAQFITARGDAFRDTLYHLQAEGAVEPWSPTGKDRGSDWHVGMPGMSGFVKPMLAGIDLRTKTRVTSIAAPHDAVSITTEGGDAEWFDCAVVTAPAPQTLDLTRDLDPAFEVLAGAEMTPCWAVMLAYGRPLENLADITRGHDDSPLALIVRNNSKPGREGPENLVIHAGGAWSRANLEAEPDDIIEKVTAALDEIAGPANGGPVHSTAHRWRYARVDRALEVPFVEGCNGHVFACGDWCLGGRAEAAFDSASMAAAHIVKHRLA